MKRFVLLGIVTLACAPLTLAHIRIFPAESGKVHDARAK